MQQRDEGIRRRRRVVAQRQLRELEELLDPDAAVAQRLDDGPGPEGVLLELGDVDVSAVERDGPGTGLDVKDVGPGLGRAEVVIAAGGRAAGVVDAVDDERLDFRRVLSGLKQSLAPVHAGVGGCEVGRQQWGESAGAGLGLGLLPALVFRGGAGLRAWDRAGCDPHAPAGRVVVRPFGEVAVERSDREQDGVDLAARSSVAGDGQPLSPGRNRVRVQPQVGLAGVDLQDLPPEQPDQAVGQATERGVIHAGLELVEVVDEQVTHA